MRIAVTGLAGQVVQSLLERGVLAGHEIIAVGRPALDLAGEAQAIHEALAAVTPVPNAEAMVSAVKAAVSTFFMMTVSSGQARSGMTARR